MLGFLPYFDIWHN